MQNARSTAAISRASEGYHFSHDALVTCKLPILQVGEFYRLEFCRLPVTLQVDDANLKLHHYKVF